MAEWLVSDSGCVPGLHTKTGKDLRAIPGNHPVLHKDHVSSDRWISGKFCRKSPKLKKVSTSSKPFTRTSWRLVGTFCSKESLLTLLLVFVDKTFLPVRVEGAGSNVDAQLLPPKQNTKTRPGLGPLSPRCHVVFPRHEKKQKTNRRLHQVNIPSGFLLLPWLKSWWSNVFLVVLCLGIFLDAVQPCEHEHLSQFCMHFSDVHLPPPPKKKKPYALIAQGSMDPPFPKNPLDSDGASPSSPKMSREKCLLQDSEQTHLFTTWNAPPKKKAGRFILEIYFGKKS